MPLLPAITDPFAFTVPERAPTELHRDALLSVLSDVAYSVVLLIAPFGFGKTTLLAQHARSTRRRTVWVTLYQDNAEPVHLAASIRYGLNLTFPEVPFEAWSAAVEERRPTASSARAFARDLTRIPAMDLILDGLDELGPEAGLWLMEVLSHLPSQHRVLLAGHGTGGLSATRLALRRDVKFLHDTDLAFTTAETDRFLHCQGTGRPTVAPVGGALDGWPAAIALSQLPSAHWQASDLIRDLLTTLPPDISAALPELAVLPVWSAGLAREAGCRLLGNWLPEVVRAGLPLSPLGNGTYRPHRLLLDILDQLLLDTPDRHAELHTAAARRSEAAKDVLTAVSHYHLAGAADDVVRVLRGVVTVAARRGQFRLVQQLLTQVPAERLTSDLVALLGHSLIETGELAHGEETLGRLAADPTSQSWALTGWCILANRRGQHRSQLSMADLGLAQPTMAQMHWFFQLHRALALLNLGQGAAGLQAAEQSLHLARMNVHVGHQGDALAVTQFACMTQGRWPEREVLLQQAIELHDRLDQPLLALEARADLADQYRTQGQLSEALYLLDTVFGSPAPVEPSAAMVFALEVRADVHFHQGEFKLASTGYREALRYAEQLDIAVLAGRLWTKLADTLLHEGLPAEAEVAFSQGVGRPGQRPGWMTPFMHLYQGQAAFAAGNLDVATGHFERVVSGSLDRTHKPRALAYLAEIGRVQEGDLPSRLIALETSMLELGNPTVLRADAGPLDGLLRLHPALRGAPQERTPSSTPPSTRLQVQLATLGRVHVTVGGVSVNVRLAKARELLVYLALHGPTSRDGLMTALWDGSTEERHLNYFRVAVRCVRDALSRQCAVSSDPLPFRQGEYQLSDELSFRVDVETLAGVPDTAPVTDLQRALDLYDGPFMGRCDADWTERLRVQAQGDAVRVALALGARLEADQPREAQAVYRRAAELDPWSEAVQMGLVRVNRALGLIQKR
ncbi:hypothetical protein GCM10008939_33890 [Deinococcus aquiradiocola]|uniref:Bacterial transcriptional activator domain-containing protein n=2 Tax=Deinococcus aquiradiocola TaxID=393059 RepID=A0A917PPD5_9DEIO|nr:hypothetical protein GCM10008939_33890 [Deinococcus aquiradiocola]